MRITQQGTVSASPPSRATVAASVAERCVSCNEGLTTPYCAQCGEQRSSDRRYSLLQFGEELLESFANFDGALLRSVTTLIARPGALTAAYMRGERSRYTKPLALFVLLSVASFLVAAVTHVHTFDTPLRIYVSQWSKPALMVARRVAERHSTVVQYGAVFDQASTTQAKTLVIIMVPVFALLVALLEVRKRRYASAPCLRAAFVHRATDRDDGGGSAGVVPVERCARRWREAPPYKRGRLTESADRDRHVRVPAALAAPGIPGWPTRRDAQGASPGGRYGSDPVRLSACAVLHHLLDDLEGNAQNEEASLYGPRARGPDSRGDAVLESISSTADTDDVVVGRQRIPPGRLERQAAIHRVVLHRSFTVRPSPRLLVSLHSVSPSPAAG
jgi:hypothetical protein